MNYRFFFALAVTLLAVSHAKGGSEANGLARQSYGEIESSLISDVEGNNSVLSPEDERRVLELGYMRSRLAIPVLFKRLAIPRSAYIANAPVTFREIPVSSGGPLILSAGPFSGLRDRYPAYKSLLRIGVSAQDCFSQSSQNGGVNSAFMLSNLAKLALGDYFKHVVETNILSCNFQFANQREKEIVLKSPYAKVFSTYQCPGSAISIRYNAMQDTLIARFKSQLASGDAELADTIYTMGFIRSDRAMPLLIDNLAVCPQVLTNAPSGFVFPAAEALIAIGPPLGICFEKLEETAPMSLEESLWLRITHEVYPEALEYELFLAAATNDMRAVRLMKALPWHRLTEAEMKSGGVEPRSCAEAAGDSPRAPRSLCENSLR